MEIFDTATLNRVIDNLDQPASFLLDVGFREEQTETSEEIHFDVESDKPRITPFVSPLVAGKIVQNQGFTTKSFKPAYAKDKRVFKPDAPLKRAIGEQIGGTMSPDQRRNIAVRRTLEDQLRMLTRREEVMASEALRLGQVTVSGEGHPTQVVDFGRHNDLTVALTGASQWGETGIDPLDNIEEWASTVQSHSGAIGTTVIFDPEAWKTARANDRFVSLLDNRRQASGSAELGPISRGMQKARFVGTIGDFDFWVYQDSYTDESGTTQKMLPDNTVLVLDPVNLQGVRAYGAIQDEKAGYQARRFFSKSWLEEDPAVRFMLLQSAPLVVPYRVNACLAATVKE